MSRRGFHVPQFMASLGRMFGLVWKAQPAIFLSLILLTTLQGIVPLVTAWITKLLFNLLALVLQGNGSVDLFRSLAVFVLQGALSSMVFAIAELNEQALFFKQYDHLMALPQPVRITPSPRAVPTLTSGIEICRVSFRYSERHPWVLRHLDLSIPAGKCLAVSHAGRQVQDSWLTRRTLHREIVLRRI